MLQVRHDRNQTSFRQTKHREDACARRSGLNRDASEIQTIVMPNNFFGGHAFPQQLCSHRFGICNNSMRQTKRAALQTFLRGSAKAVGLAFVGYARADASHCRRRHSENICVKVVGVNYVDFILGQEARKPAQLRDEIPIIEAGERILGNFSEAESIRFAAQRSFVLQTREPHAATPALVQLSHQLKRLALAAALLEAVNHVQNVWFQLGMYPPSFRWRTCPPEMAGTSPRSKPGISLTSSTNLRCHNSSMKSAHNSVA